MLCCSGFLLSVNLFTKKKCLPNFGRYLLLRWLRFTPSLMGYILLTIVSGFLGTGPLFHTRLIEPYILLCVDHLLSHLLYINNWLDYRNMVNLSLLLLLLLLYFSFCQCGFQPWYQSVDFQLYLLAYPF